ncbi:MAG: hypothetical protein GY714_00690 [Desulfobacterales bacterium]|nr:hypothetical protein [Desulfobacterales bacterium]
MVVIKPSKAGIIIIIQMEMGILIIITKIMDLQIELMIIRGMKITKIGIEIVMEIARVVATEANKEEVIGIAIGVAVVVIIIIIVIIIGEIINGGAKKGTQKHFGRPPPSLLLSLTPKAASLGCKMHKTVSKSCHVCFNRVKRAARRIYFTLPSHFRRKLGWTFLSKNTWKNPLFSFFRCAGASFSFNCACEKSVSLFHFNCPSRGSVRSKNLFSGFSSFSSSVCNPGKVLPFGDARFSGSELISHLFTQFP